MIKEYSDITSSTFGATIKTKSTPNQDIVTPQVYGHRYFSIESSVDLLKPENTTETIEPYLAFFLVSNKKPPLQNQLIFSHNPINKNTQTFEFSSNSEQIILFNDKIIDTNARYALKKWPIKLHIFSPYNINDLYDYALENTRKRIFTDVRKFCLQYPGATFDEVLQDHAARLLEKLLSDGVMSMYSPLLMLRSNEINNAILKPTALIKGLGEFKTITCKRAP